MSPISWRTAAALRGFVGSFAGARAALAAVGLILLIGAAVTLAPLALLLFDPREAGLGRAFVAAAAAEAIAGVVLSAGFRLRSTRGLTIRGGSSAVVLGWLLVCVGSAWPIARGTGLGFPQALFEAVSGWTTTGLSVVDVLKAPHIVLLWRSTMQLAGGAGLAIIMLAVFSLPIGAGLYRAEGRGSQLAPNVVRSAKLVVAIYAAYAAVGVAAYRLAGLSWFDAVNHSFAAVSTGGFSTRPQSIGYWDSPVVEAVTIPLMLLGNTNFLTASLLFRGRFRAFAANGETKVVAALAPASALALFLLLSGTLYPTLGKAARVAVFEATTALTTTGFSTVSYDKWPPAAWLILIVLMIVGGGTCSTAGGVKQMRIYVLARAVLAEIRALFLPRGTLLRLRAWDGEGSVILTERQLWQTGAFLFLYVATLAGGTFVIAACGFPLRESLFEYASALGTVGLSVGVTSASMPAPVLWVEMAGMLLGRLEFYVIFVFVGSIGRSVRLLADAFIGPLAGRR